MPVLVQRNARGARYSWSLTSRKSCGVLWLADGALNDMGWNAGRRKENLWNDVKVMSDWFPGWRRRTSWSTVVVIGGNRSHSESDAFRFPEQRDENDGGEYHALRGDGNDQRAVANAAFAFTLLWTAFDETALQKTKIILRIGFGLDRHHTPPEESSARRNRNSCDASPLWVAQLPQETGAALAGM